MNRVDPVVVHYLQMSLHAISLRKNVLNNLCMKHHYTKDTLIWKFVLQNLVKKFFKNIKI